MIRIGNHYYNYNVIIIIKNFHIHIYDIQIENN